MQPRRKQPSITIRSERATRRLRELSRSGRSQAAIIEEALDRMPDPQPQERGLEERRAIIDKLTERLAKSGIPSMAEFDAREYDDRGNPR
jgi:antitoxin VapB